MFIRTKAATAGLAVGLVLMPVLALAETGDVQSQIQTLLNQIKALQEQLRTLVASSTATGGAWMSSSTAPWMKGDDMMPLGQMGKMRCLTLGRNLRIGHRGDDVKELQQTLASDPESGFTGAPTGFFGPMTAQAVKKFQMHFGIASSTDGSVGPLTRGFFERQCGKGPDAMNDKMRGVMLGGTITASSATSVTVQTPKGDSKSATITASTTIQVFSGTSTPPTTGTTADLTVGKKAMISGPVGADGTTTAMHIKVGDMPPPPMMGDGQGMHGSPQGPMPMMSGPMGPAQGNNYGPQN